MAMKEITELRTERGKTFNLGNGRKQLELCLSPIHYKDDYADKSESWKDIDLTIRDGKMTAAPYTLTIYYNAVLMRDKRTGSVATIIPSTIGTKIARLDEFVIVPHSEGFRLKRTILKGEPTETKFNITFIGAGIKIKSSGWDAQGEPLQIRATFKDGLLSESIIGIFSLDQCPLEIDPDFTIQPCGADVWIQQDTPNTNRNNYSQLRVFSQVDYQNRSLVQFPITWGTDIPAEILILNAVLSLYYYSYTISNPVGRTYVAQRLLRLNWVEAEATWNSYKSGSAWTTAGAGSDGNDITSTDAANSIVPASYGWMTWTVTAQVQAAQTGNLNIGFRLLDSGLADNMKALFYSRETDAGASFKPKLIITYVEMTPAVWDFFTYG